MRSWTGPNRESASSVRPTGARSTSPFPTLPKITPRRMVSDGDLVVLEASLDYGGTVYKTVFIFELKAGKIAKETAYWSEPFEAPAWRAKWVEKS